MLWVLIRIASYIEAILISMLWVLIRMALTNIVGAH